MEKKIVTIASGKGGVGKSTITALLARSLQKRGAKVGVLDLDIYGPSQVALLPETRPLVQKEGRIFPARCGEIELVSIAHFYDHATCVRAPIANQLVSQFLTQVEWSDLDWLLIDLPPGTSDVHLTVCAKLALTGALLVTTPHLLSFLDVKKAATLFSQVHVPLLGVIENMSHFEGKEIFGHGAGERIAEELDCPLLDSLPLDLHLGPRDLMTIEKKLHLLCEQFEDPIVALHVREDGTLCIDWREGRRSEHTPFALQSCCPCAKCLQEKEVAPDVALRSVERVGRYGLRFSFSSGCSFGIYELQRLAEVCV